MKLNKIFLIGFLFLIAVNVNAVHIATPHCQISDVSPGVGYTEIFSVVGVDPALGDTTNAHGAIDPATYTSKVWCPDPFVRDATCASPTSIPLLSLSDTENAHAEEPGQGNYFNEICLDSGDGSTVTCTFSNGADCVGPSIGLVSISDVTNAHIEEYGVVRADGENYNINFCCTAGVISTPAESCTLSGQGTIDMDTETDVAYTANCFDGTGAPTNCPSAPIPNWTSSPSGIVSVNSGGVVNPTTTGNTTLTVEFTESSIPITFSCNRDVDVISSGGGDVCNNGLATCQAACGAGEEPDTGDPTCDLGGGSGVCCIPFGTDVCTISLVDSSIDEGDTTTANVTCTSGGVPIACPADLTINSDDTSTATVTHVSGDPTGTVTGESVPVAQTANISASSLTSPGVDCSTVITVSPPGGGTDFCTTPGTTCEAGPACLGGGSIDLADGVCDFGAGTGICCLAGPATTCRIIPDPVTVQVSTSTTATVECFDAASNPTTCPVLGVDSDNDGIATATISGTDIIVTAGATVDETTINATASFTCPATVNVTDQPIQEWCGDGIVNQGGTEMCDLGASVGGSPSDISACDAATQFCNLSCQCQDNSSLAGNHFGVTLIVKNNANIIDNEFGKSLLDPINLEIAVQRFPAAGSAGATLELSMNKAVGGPDILEALGWTDILISGSDFTLGGEVYVAESLNLANIEKIPTTHPLIETSSYNITAKVTSALDGGDPADDEQQLFDNQDSEGIVIRIGADTDGIDFVAAPEIHPIFIVLILLGVIFIARRK